MSSSPIRVAVTGAAGQISYALLFRIAAGEMLGRDQPVILQLLEVTPAMKALNGVAMELDDCAFPLLAGIEMSDDPNVAFKNAQSKDKTVSRAYGGSRCHQCVRNRIVRAFLIEEGKIGKKKMLQMKKVKKTA